MVFRLFVFQIRIRDYFCILLGGPFGTIHWFSKFCQAFMVPLRFFVVLWICSDSGDPNLHRGECFAPYPGQLPGGPIASAGAIARRNPAMESGLFRSSGRFFDWNTWISGNPFTQDATIWLNLVFPKYQLWALRNEKVIRSQATVVHDTEISKTRNFRISKLVVEIKNMDCFYIWMKYWSKMVAPLACALRFGKNHRYHQNLHEKICGIAQPWSLVNLFWCRKLYLTTHGAHITQRPLGFATYGALCMAEKGAKHPP